MRYLILIIALQISLASSAQTNGLRISDQIPIAEDTVQSVFQWVAQYLSYDTQFPEYKKAYSEPSELISYALKERTGICQHYAELFNQIMNELGYPAYVVSGYSHETIGNSHAWNAVKIKGQWFLFDPTFASGGITPSGRFIKEYDAQWYKVHPDEFIRSHMPFDYVWQFKSEPISFTSFDQKKYEGKIKTDFNYGRYVDTYVKLDDKAWIKPAIERINEQSYRNPLISKYLSYLNSISYGLEINEKVDAHNIEIDRLNEAVALFNNSVTQFNNYISAKNRRFNVTGYDKGSLLPNMLSIQKDVSEAMKIFSSISTHNEETMKVVRENTLLGRDFLRNVDSELSFIKSYVRAR